MIQGPIILIDDDHEDLELITEAFKILEVENQVIPIDRATKAISFFEETEERPFLILCDINMPQMGGLELRQQLYKSQKLRIKTVPFLFFSTSGDNPAINNAYQLSIQGYFVKPPSFDELLQVLKKIVDYWEISQIPQLK